MNEKIEIKFIALDEPAFYELVDMLYERIRSMENNGPSWISGEETMKMLNITSPTSLQAIRDTPGALKVSYLSSKNLLYERQSVLDYLERKSRRH